MYFDCLIIIVNLFPSYTALFASASKLIIDFNCNTSTWAIKLSRVATTDSFYSLTSSDHVGSMFVGWKPLNPQWFHFHAMCLLRRNQTWSDTALYTKQIYECKCIKMNCIDEMRSMRWIISMDLLLISWCDDECGIKDLSSQSWKAMSQPKKIPLEYGCQNWLFGKVLDTKISKWDRLVKFEFE